MSFTEHNVNGLIYDTSDVITAAGSGAVHAFTTRHGGVSPAPYDSLNFADNKGDTSENLLENYRRLGEAVGFDASRAVGCRQIHSDLVRIASEEDAGKILWDDRPYDADGLITNVPNLPLFAYRTAASSRSTTRLRVRSVRCTLAGAVRRAASRSRPPCR